MPKKEAEQKEPTEFPLTLDEFLTELPSTQVETKAGFRHVMQDVEEGNGPKLRSDWKKLFELYQKQPTSTTWADWLKSQDKPQGGN